MFENMSVINVINKNNINYNLKKLKYELLFKEKRTYIVFFYRFHLLPLFRRNCFLYIVAPREKGKENVPAGNHSHLRVALVK